MKRFSAGKIKSAGKAAAGFIEKAAVTAASAAAEKGISFISEKVGIKDSTPDIYCVNPDKEVLRQAIIEAAEELERRKEGTEREKKNRKALRAVIKIYYFIALVAVLCALIGILLNVWKMIPVPWVAWIMLFVFIALIILAAVGAFWLMVRICLTKDDSFLISHFTALISTIALVISLIALFS